MKKWYKLYRNCLFRKLGKHVWSAVTWLYKSLNGVEFERLQLGASHHVVMKGERFTDAPEVFGLGKGIFPHPKWRGWGICHQSFCYLEITHTILSQEKLCLQLVVRFFSTWFVGNQSLPYISRIYIQLNKGEDSSISRYLLLPRPPPKKKRSPWAAAPTSCLRWYG